MEKLPKIGGEGLGDEVGNKRQGLDGILSELFLGDLDGALDEGRDNLEDLRVKFWGLTNAAEDRNKGTTALDSRQKRSVSIIIVAKGGRKTEEFFGKLAANRNSVGTDRVLELVDNVVQNKDEVIAIDFVDQAKHDLEEVRENVAQKRLGFLSLHQGTESQSSLDPCGELRMFQNIQHTLDPLDNKLGALNIDGVLSEAQTRSGHNEGNWAVHVGEDVLSDEDVERIGKQLAVHILLRNGPEDVESSLHPPGVFEVVGSAFVLVKNVDEHVQQKAKGFTRTNANEGADEINHSGFHAEVLLENIVLLSNVLRGVLLPGSFVLVVERNQGDQHLDDKCGTARGDDWPSGGMEDGGSNKPEEGAQQSSGDQHSLSLQVDNLENTLEDFSGVIFGEVVRPLPLFLLL